MTSFDILGIVIALAVVGGLILGGMYGKPPERHARAPLREGAAPQDPSFVMAFPPRRDGDPLLVQACTTTLRSPPMTYGEFIYYCGGTYAEPWHAGAFPRVPLPSPGAVVYPEVDFGSRDIGGTAGCNTYGPSTRMRTRDCY